MKMILRAWRFLGHINLFMGIIGCMVVDLLLGYSQLKFHGALFDPINDLGFYRWAQTYGSHYPSNTAWLFILVGLLGLLSVNTFVCTTERVWVLVKSRHAFSRRSRFLLRFGPHIMHYSMLIMFLGYLVSYLSAGTHMGKVLLPGKSITIARPACTITLDKLDIDYYSGGRMIHMDRRAIDVRAVLTIRDAEGSKTAELGFNSPVRFAPLSIHLKKFAPLSKGGMGRKKYITVIIKNDPGMKFYFSGMVLFTLGLFMYLWDKLSRQTRQEDRA